MKKKSIILALVLILLIITLHQLIVTSNYSSAQVIDRKIIYVDDEGADYTSIQDAIDNASDGDTVFVFSGVYYENVIINKSINLIGEDKSTTIIDGSKKDSVIILSPSSNYVNLTGFTIQNSGFQMYRAGVDVNSDYNTIAGNIIKNCNHGIALDLWGHNCKVYDNTFENNVFGLVVYSVFPNNNVIYHNNFIDNSVNAYDNSNSMWEYLGEGNYWSDYTGFDSDGDGIGDTPYNVTGGSAQDHYPLMEPYETPGFEFVLVFVAFALVLILFRKKQRLG